MAESCASSLDETAQHLQPLIACLVRASINRAVNQEVLEVYRHEAFRTQCKVTFANCAVCSFDHDKMKKLIDFITTMPPEDAGKDRGHK